MSKCICLFATLDGMLKDVLLYEGNNIFDNMFICT